MNENYFGIWKQGFEGQLGILDLEETLVHLENYLCAQLLGPGICSTYLNRILRDPEVSNSPRACFYARYLFEKLLRMNPFSADLCEKYLRIFQDQRISRLHEELKRHDHSPKTLMEIMSLNMGLDHKDMTEFYLKLLELYPDYVEAAHNLLDVDFYLSRDPRWLHGFSCPPGLKGKWQARMFNFYASQNNHKMAWNAFPFLDRREMDETTLNHAAEMHVAKGDTDTAIKLYTQSLELDRFQVPVRMRLGQLESPFCKDPDALSRHKVCICLYSWNKAQLLSETLDSLLRSNIGNAKIRVLINGSEDDSCQRLDAVKAAHPEADLEYFALPVNIGAPGARNWLISLDETREADFVAFMDDDVLLQEDWLEWMLTVAEQDQRIGVVGCKILDSRRPHRYQYLYRHINIATKGLLRFCFESPLKQYDTSAYDFVVETRNVMGCLHLFRTEALRDVPRFDIRFSPSQVDDLDHDIELCLKGWKVWYCGLVSCIHRQKSGLGQYASVDTSSLGNTLGNDIKLHYKHAHHMDELAKLDNLSLPVYRDLGIFPVRPRMKSEE